MHSDRADTYKVGFFIGGTLFVLALLVFFIGQQQRVFYKMDTFITSFASVEGLEIGNPVKIDGVTVGRITDIRLPLEPGRRRITIDMDVHRKYRGLIRADSVVRIRSMGLLGDKFLEITSGSSPSPCIPPGGTIRSAQPTDISRLLSRGEDTMDNILSITADLRRILDRLNKGETPLNSIVAKSNANLDKMSRILDKVDNGEGFLGSLINNRRGGEIVANLSAASASLRKISETMAGDLEKDESIWAHLTRDKNASETFATLLENISSISASLADIGEAIHAKKDALLPRLMNDEKFAREFTQEIGETARHLKSIAKKMDEGDGSAAGFINDPSIYKGIESVLFGIKKSKILKALIRHERKKGEKVTRKEKGE